MPVQFKISITKEVLRLSRFCSSNEFKVSGENCAIKYALNDLFPDAHISGDYIYPYGFHEETDLKIELPKIAKDFIRVFDSLSKMPNVRLRLPEFEFDILISDEIISQINIDNLRSTIEGNKNHFLPDESTPVFTESPYVGFPMVCL